MVTTTSFSVTWDYRCPFARNAHEHVIVGLQDGADWDVEFLPFSLNQAHVEAGGTPVWDDPARRLDLLAGQVGLVVRDRSPDKFLRVHRALFALRHDQGADLRDAEALRGVLAQEGVDATAVFDEIDCGWPLDAYRKAHEAEAGDFNAFGVPTFMVGGQAAFVRVMTRPDGDAALARKTIEHIIGLLEDHPDLNEFKHTTIER